MHPGILRRTRGLLLATSVLALGTMAFTAAEAGPVTVYVGYVDNLRASGFFPTKWIGDAGVVSETPGGQSLDAGAIRIDNGTGASVQIDNFQVHFPSNGSTFTLWSSLTIGNGQTGIFTQTTSYNFDTSDFGIFGGSPPSNLAPNVGGNNGIGGCSSPAGFYTGTQKSMCDAAIPVISFDIGSNHFSFSDTGHILDTGEYDFINGSSDGNESINWNLVGSSADRGGNTGIPEPLTLSIFGIGLAGLVGARRRKKQA